MLRTHLAPGPMTHRRAPVLIAVAALFLGIVGPPSTARAGSPTPTPARMTYDLLIERPLGLVELVAGAAILPLAYPIAAVNNDGDLVVERCVRTPSRSTFTRALGRLDENRRSGCSPVAFSLELAQLSIGAALSPLGWIFGGSPFSHPRRGEGDGVEI